MVKYAPPAIEVNEDGVITDKSQDAGWLRARYFEASARIEELEKGVCRIICRTAKENWIVGYETAALIDAPGLSARGLRKEAEHEYNDWKRRQPKANG
ncbi:hypothetical protein LCGC14_1438330 [marine sediment metagenome]|uniref:Uncharacterized protein n=1 Tax=marine sediment metagenome TaxID=412755 RepID=A0A0F9M1Y2_9ZZZZ